MKGLLFMHFAEEGGRQEQTSTKVVCRRGMGRLRTPRRHPLGGSAMRYRIGAKQSGAESVGFGPHYNLDEEKTA